MSIFIDDGITVLKYCTNRKTEKAIITLLEQIEDMVSSESHEGCRVDIVEGDIVHEVNN